MVWKMSKLDAELDQYSAGIPQQEEETPRTGLDAELDAVEAQYAEGKEDQPLDLGPDIDLSIDRGEPGYSDADEEAARMATMRYAEQARQAERIPVQTQYQLPAIEQQEGEDLETYKRRLEWENREFKKRVAAGTHGTEESAALEIGQVAANVRGFVTGNIGWFDPMSEIEAGNRALDHLKSKGAIPADMTHSALARIIQRDPGSKMWKDYQKELGIQRHMVDREKQVQKITGTPAPFLPKEYMVDMPESLGGGQVDIAPSQETLSEIVGAFTPWGASMRLAKWGYNGTNKALSYLGKALSKAPLLGSKPAQVGGKIASAGLSTGAAATLEFTPGRFMQPEMNPTATETFIGGTVGGALIPAGFHGTVGGVKLTYKGVTGGMGLFKKLFTSPDIDSKFARKALSKGQIGGSRAGDKLVELAMDTKEEIFGPIKQYLITEGALKESALGRVTEGFFEGGRFGQTGKVVPKMQKGPAAIRKGTKEIGEAVQKGHQKAQVLYDYVQELVAPADGSLGVVQERAMQAFKMGEISSDEAAQFVLRYNTAIKHYLAKMTEGEGTKLSKSKKLAALLDEGEKRFFKGDKDTGLKGIEALADDIEKAGVGNDFTSAIMSTGRSINERVGQEIERLHTKLGRLASPEDRLQGRIRINDKLFHPRDVELPDLPVPKQARTDMIRVEHALVGVRRQIEPDVSQVVPEKWFNFNTGKAPAPRTDERVIYDEINNIIQFITGERIAGGEGPAHVFHRDLFRHLNRLKELGWGGKEGPVTTNTARKVHRLLNEATKDGIDDVFKENGMPADWRRTYEDRVEVLMEAQKKLGHLFDEQSPTKVKQNLTNYIRTAIEEEGIPQIADEGAKVTGLKSFLNEANTTMGIGREAIDLWDDVYKTQRSIRHQTLRQAEEGAERFGSKFEKELAREKKVGEAVRAQKSMDVVKTPEQLANSTYLFDDIFAEETFFRSGVDELLSFNKETVQDSVYGYITGWASVLDASAKGNPVKRLIGATDTATQRRVAEEIFGTDAELGKLAQSLGRYEKLGKAIQIKDDVAFQMMVTTMGAGTAAGIYEFGKEILGQGDDGIKVGGYGAATVVGLIVAMTLRRRGMEKTRRKLMSIALQRRPIQTRKDGAGMQKGFVDDMVEGYRGWLDKMETKARKELGDTRPVGERAKEKYSALKKKLMPMVIPIGAAGLMDDDPSAIKPVEDWIQSSEDISKTNKAKMLSHLRKTGNLIRPDLLLIQGVDEMTDRKKESDGDISNFIGNIKKKKSRPPVKLEASESLMFKKGERF
jgi:hypothetical protein